MRNMDYKIEWSKLQKIQSELDHAIMNPQSLTYSDTLYRRILGTVVEIGELANEVGTFKFWPNENPRGMDTRILDELADVLHLILGLLNTYQIEAGEIRPYKGGDINAQFLGLITMILRFDGMPQNWEGALQYFLGLVALLGVTEWELFEAYLYKYQKNMNRVKENVE